MMDILMEIWCGLFGGGNKVKRVKIIYLIVGIVGLMFILKMYCNGRFINSEKIAKQQCKEILRCLDDNDSDGLRSMFCNKSKAYLTLDKQIQDAMDFFEGRTISYNILLSSGGTSYENGVITSCDIYPFIKDIVTDAQKKYRIRFCEYIVCKENSDKEGISEIIIESEDGKECVIRTYIE